MTPSYRVAIEAAIILWLLFPLWRLHQTFFRWIGQHPLFAIEVGLLLIILYGVIGSDYGLRELFWHDSAWVQVIAGLNVSALLLLLVALTCSLDGPGNPKAIIAFLRGARRQRLPLGRGLNRRVQSWIDRRRIRSSAAYRLAVLYLSVLVAFAMLVAIPTIVWGADEFETRGAARIVLHSLFPSTFLLVASGLAAAVTAWTDEPRWLGRGAPLASAATGATAESRIVKRSLKDRTLGILSTAVIPSTLTFLAIFLGGVLFFPSASRFMLPRVAGAALMCFGTFAPLP